MVFVEDYFMVFVIEVDLKMCSRSLLLLLTVVCIVSAQQPTSARPPPPSEYPPETGRPKDMRNCRINAATLLPWIVGIWDKVAKVYVGHGSMITYITFITTCRNHRPPGSYVAVGQYVWDINLPEDPCMQERNVQSIYKHPLCTGSPKTATFFDFSVMKLVVAFDISETSYPTMFLSTTPYELFYSIKYYDMIYQGTGCALHYFRTQTERPPVFDSKSSVKAIPFHSKCVDLLCEKSPPDTGFVTMCKKRFGERANGTMLCMANSDETPIRLGVDDKYWYAGSPLVCNHSALGIAAQAKIRKGYPGLQTDIHFVVTFLRVWPWLIEQRISHSAPWVEKHFIDEYVDTLSNGNAPVKTIRNWTVVVFLVVITASLINFSVVS